MNKVIIVHYEEDPDAIERFQSLVQKLWYRHVDYTHQAIISIMAGIDNTAAIIDRLMKNQEDIGNAIIPYYGEEAAAELTRLLKEHVTISSDIFKAIKEARSTTDLEAAWNTNAEAIATFLDAADSGNWPKGVVLSVLKKHVECTMNAAKAHFAKDWNAEMVAYEDCCDAIYTLAEVMSGGIVNKFPEYFVMQYSSKTIKKK